MGNEEKSGIQARKEIRGLGIPLEKFHDIQRDTEIAKGPFIIFYAPSSTVLSAMKGEVTTIAAKDGGVDFHIIEDGEPRDMHYTAKEIEDAEKMTVPGKTYFTRYAIRKTE